MGNDGGSIPTRRELVKEAARNPTVSALKEKQKEYLAHRWSICPISHKPLTKPIVSDYSGELYNKDAILQFLLPAEVTSIDKDEYEKFIQGRVKSLKDVVEVQFQAEHDAQTLMDTWVCPVTSKQLGSSVKAVYLVPCGHAFSQEAIKEMKGGDQCTQCGEAYEDRNIIPILPSTEEDKATVLKRINALRAEGLTHSLKKAAGNKKRKANGETRTDTVTVKPAKDRSNGTKPDLDFDLDSRLASQPGMKDPKTSNGIKNAATASLTARVLEEEAAKKKRKTENDNISSLYTRTDGQRKDGDFMTRGFSIPANAKYKH